MLPLLVISPSVVISGYVCWYQGQHLVLTNHYNQSNIAADEVPDQSFKSYIIGLTALGCAYYAQSLVFPFIEGGTILRRELKEHVSSQRFTVHNKEGGPGRYMPPKDFLELAKKVVPPIALRVGASSIAFFCAGIVQNYVALRQQPLIPGRQ